MDIRYEVGIFEQEQSEIYDRFMCQKKKTLLLSKEIDHHKKKRLWLKKSLIIILKSQKGCIRSAGLSLIILTKY
jgi:hypothetical protein